MHRHRPYRRDADFRPCIIPSRLLVSPDRQQSDLVAPNVEKAGNFFCYVEVLTADRPSAYGYIAHAAAFRAVSLNVASG